MAHIAIMVALQVAPYPMPVDTADSAHVQYVRIIALLLLMVFYSSVLSIFTVNVFQRLLPFGYWGRAQVPVAIQPAHLIILFQSVPPVSELMDGMKSCT